MAERSKTQVSEESPSWQKYACHPAFICLLLAVATLAVFGRVGWYEFVNYDDSDYVTANAQVQGGLTWENVKWAFQTGHASNWHPLTWLSHIVDWQIFGELAGGHHLASVGFHIANTLLVFLVISRMTGALWRSAVVAGLFGLHPMHVESVAWVSERKDLLSGLFFLLTLWAYVRYVEAQRQKSEIRDPKSEGSPKSEIRTAIGWYLLTLFLFAFGLMSKPMLVTVPFVLLLLDYWPLGRSAECGVRSADSETLRSGFRWACWGRLLLEKFPFFGLSIASCVITYLVQRKGGAVSTSLPLAGRLANAVVSYARYVGKAVWPQNLSVLYPHPGYWGADALIGASLFLVAALAAVILLSRGRPYLAVGWFWFVGMLVPTIGLVQVGIQSMADRYSYLPSIGFFVMLVWGLSELLARSRERGHSCPQQPKDASRVPIRQPSGLPQIAEPEQHKSGPLCGLDRNVRAPFLAVGAVICLLVCALLSAHQLRYWRTSETLFRRAAEVTQRNYLAYNNLGFYLSGKGNIQEAMENYQKALDINPDYEDALNNMGFALAARKKYSQAIGYYEKALQIRPKHAEVHNNLGNALAETGKTEDAIKHYEIVLEQKPDHADAHNNLGIALAMQGKLDEAMTHFHAAIRLKPTDAGAHSNLGNGLAAQHKLDEAIKEYQESLRLRPEDAQARNNLGNVLAEQGKLEGAITNYQEALRLNAENPETEFNLGMALARQGKLDDAASHFEKALTLKPDYAAARNELNRLRPPSKL